MLPVPVKRPAARFVVSAAALANLLLFLVCASTSPVSAAYKQLNLELKDIQGNVLVAFPVHEGESFGIRYIHSVALTPVTDIFTVKEGAIWLERTIYQDFGAGLPHEPQQGQKMTQEYGKITISGYNRRLSAFALRVGRVANHQLLIFADSPEAPVETIPLNSLARPGDVINFSVRKIER